MGVSVIYEDGMMDVVDPQRLQTLIDADSIVKFQRSDGWVYLGIDPVRTANSGYQGPEKRMN